MEHFGCCSIGLMGADSVDIVDYIYIFLFTRVCKLNIRVLVWFSIKVLCARSESVADD